MSIGLSLIALVLGYKILIESRKEKKELKNLGLAVATFVMAAAFISSLCSIAIYSGKGGDRFYKSFCALKSQGVCPHTSY